MSINPMDTDKLTAILEPFRLSTGSLRRLMSIHEEQLRRGLSGERGSIPMLPSYLPELPNGTETGRFLAVDLGGTNLRIMSCLLTPGKPIQMTSHNYTVSAEQMTGDGRVLFEFMADKLAEFMDSEQHLLNASERLSLGFVFSFPCEQISLTSANLLWWTKGFTCTNILGKDVVSMFQKAIDAKGLQVQVRAIMNDTVGSLAATAYEHGDKALIGGVVSTGCNVSYVEDAKNITKLSTEYSFPSMIIDTEWEEFGNDGEFAEAGIETEIDRRVNADSVHVGKQTSDKYVAGLHMGEICRLILLQYLEAVKDTLNIEQAKLMERLETKGSFPTHFMSQILNDDVGKRDWIHCRKVLLDELQMTSSNSRNNDELEDLCQIVWMIVSVVNDRSAGILAAELSSLIRHTGQLEGLIGLGGSVFGHRPSYRRRVLETMNNDLLPSDYQWSIEFVDEGSGKGAALVAAVAERMNLD